MDRARFLTQYWRLLRDELNPFDGSMSYRSGFCHVSAISLVGIPKRKPAGINEEPSVEYTSWLTISA